MMRVLLLALVLASLLPLRAGAHALEPGFLEIRPLGGADWRVTWRKPQVQGQPMEIDASLPEGCSPRRADAPHFDGRAFVSGFVTTCSGGLAGGTIAIEGLEAQRTDVLVRYTLEDGESPQSRRLTPDSPSFVVPPPQGVFSLAQSYFALGVDHILQGVDHLLFVLLLLLVIREVRPLVAAITAFTVAHSFSLAAAALGWIWVPAAPVEAIVALSIMILAAELLQREGEGLQLTRRFPWAVAFAFGLLHGLGFARALLEVGLPEGEVPLALLAFNLGVEAGQLLFVFVCVAAGLAIARLYPELRARALAPRGPVLRLAAYAVGTLSAYWVVERVAGFIA